MMNFRTTVGLGLVLLLGAGFFPAQAAGVEMAQKVSLALGWNAVYLTVTPDEDANAVFSRWPVERVGAYNPAAYLETRQFSASGSTEGAESSGFVMWRRDDPGASQLRGLVANTVYVCYATNTFSTTLYGVPAAPRTTWHPTATNTPLNFVGISLAPEKTTTAEAYFNGLDVGNTTYQKVYQLQGGYVDKVSTGQLKPTDPLSAGQVVLMEAEHVSDWSGVLFVAPQEGIDFSTNANQRTLTVRNDGATNRTVRLTLSDAQVPSGEMPLAFPSGLLLRDASVYTNAWFSLDKSVSFARSLAPGEEIPLSFAIDRAQLMGIAEGTIQGCLLHFEDADGGSQMRVTVPLQVTVGAAADVTRLWPMGLWLATATFETVTAYDHAGTGSEVPAGGRAKVRVPLYVDELGAMTLLSRFIYGTDTNGVTHVYSPRTENAFPVAIANARRVSSAVLPADGAEKMVAAAEGAFGSRAAFAFTVAEDSPINPMRHALHPAHDGLRTDFTTKSPSGDDLRNYLTAVKPESFSITNRVLFTWQESRGRAWNPEETLAGTLVWELEGVRREGPVRMSGPFVMKRIANVPIDK